MATATKKLDFVREARELYAPPRDPVLVDVPEFPFAMVDGHGDPNEALEYREAMEALYSVSYTLKFMLKRGPLALDYRVAPLEGLWWADDMTAFLTGAKSDWDWTMMIRQPEQVDQDLVEAAISQALERRELPGCARLRLERFHEGRAAQVMHIGPYSAEGPTIERLHAFIAESGLERRGKHHEIYLGDPRRAAPEKLRTVVRQPVG